MTIRIVMALDPVIIERQASRELKSPNKIAKKHFVNAIY